MAITCKTLQPIVLLTDVMEPNLHEIETVFVPGYEEESQNWVEVEQTEPLDLCLSGTIMNGLAYYEEGSEDDVIFVKEYKTPKEKALKRKAAAVPRRNPVRRARTTKRFKEYTDGSFEDSDFLDDPVDEEEHTEAIDENSPPKKEDSEDWQVENVVKKRQPRRKPVLKRGPQKGSRLGRRKKCPSMDAGLKRVSLKEIEKLIENNLLRVRQYVSNVIATDKLFSGIHTDRTKSAVDMFKSQAALLAITRDVKNEEFLKLVDT